MLDDNGAIIVDSHVICGYLVDKYAKEDSLYPKDVVRRAHVTARLFYNAGNVFSRSRFLFEPVVLGNSPDLDERKKQYIALTWEVIDRFVSESPYVCGNNLTIADLCLIATISSADEFVPIDPVAYPNLTKWIERMRQLPYYHEKNEIGAKEFQNFVRAKAQKNASA